MNPTSSDLLTLRLFGRFEAARGGLPLPGLHIREGERLLAFLTLRTSEPVSARELAERFWPAEAHGNLMGQNDFPSLRQALFALRKALGTEAERLTRPARATIHLDLTDADADILAFDRLAAAVSNENGAWEAAIDLYRGPLLEGWQEAWAIEARTRRRRTLERLLRRLAQDAQTQNANEKAALWLRRLLVSRPEEESAARDLMRLLAVQGQYVEMEEAQESLAEAVQTAGRPLEPETLMLLAALRMEREQNSVRPTPAIPKAAPMQQASPISPQEVLITDSPTAPEFLLEPAGGAVLVGSPFYVERPADADFAQAMTRRP